MTDRDTFAAAALTGYTANPAWDDAAASIVAEQAYADADAMLAERSRTGQKMTESDIPHAVCPVRDSSTNNDAATVEPGGSVGLSPGSSSDPINRNAERESPRRECGESSLRDVSQLDNSRAAGGPEHSYVIDGVDRPVSYAETDEKRVFYDTKRDTTEPRNGALGEPVAWAVMQNDWYHGAHLDYSKAVSLATAANVAGAKNPWNVVPLYRSPTLTDAERADIATAAASYSGIGEPVYERIAATLRGLLERLA